jgi:TrwC relaxase
LVTFWAFLAQVFFSACRGALLEVAHDDILVSLSSFVPGVGMLNVDRMEDVKDKKTGLAVIHPETGDVQKREVSNRRAGYDFTFSVPKSVSLYPAVNEDKVVEQAIAEALDETMVAIEARMETKVRKGYQHDNRVSPNQTWSMRSLFTARAGLSMGSLTPLPHSRLRDERDSR